MRLCAGPGRLAQALGVSAAHNGLSLMKPPFLLLERKSTPPIISGPRIGISKAMERPCASGSKGRRFSAARSHRPWPPSRALRPSESGCHVVKR